jgi:hypothetical protein
MGSQTRRVGCWLASVLAGLMGVASIGAHAASSGYHLLRQVVLPDVTGWDYLSIDPQARLLFLSNNSGVIVLNVDTLERIGTVPNPPNLPGVGLVHGVAFSDALGRGFISHEIPSSVYIFNLKTLARVSVAPTDRGTDAIVYDPATKRVFTMNGKYRGIHDISVIDGTSGRRVGTIPLPGVPEFAVVDGRGHLYVNIASLSELGEIDTHTLKLTARWPMAPCKEPSGLAIDVQHHRLFAGCDNQIMEMIDADNGRVLGSVHSGDGTDANRFDPGTGLAFSSNGESATLTVAHEDDSDHLRLVENVPTEDGARTMALDTQTHRIFLLAAKFGPRPANPGKDNPHGYPVVVPGTAQLLVYGP